MGHRTSTTPIPKDQLDILISAVIQEEGNEQLLEWSLNDDGTRVIKSNRGIKRDCRLLNGSILGMLLSPLGDLSHTSILYYCDIMRHGNIKTLEMSS
jgi:hypothetical protein